MAYVPEIEKKLKLTTGDILNKAHLSSRWALLISTFCPTSNRNENASMTAQQNNSIISIGDVYRLYGSSVQTHDALPNGTYIVRFSKMEGYSLERVNTMRVGSEKVYGNRDHKIDKIIRSYNTVDRSLGVMLSGDKGQGKSLFLRMLAEAAHEQLELPVIRVTEDAPGLADFLDQLGECVIVFDEFEKVFTEDEDTGNRQNQFLSLFDGTGSTKRIYCVTINQLRSVSSYLVNRPGRFHYHLRFDYPDAAAVREYLLAEAPRAAEKVIEQAVSFSQKVNLNYDHLRAIAHEIDHNPDEDFGSLIDDLNIKAVENSTYRVKLALKNGTVVTGTTYTSLFAGDEVAIPLHTRNRTYLLTFDPTYLQEDLASGALTVDGVHVNDHYRDDEDEDYVDIEQLRLTIYGQDSYSYSKSV